MGFIERGFFSILVHRSEAILMSKKTLDQLNSFLVARGIKTFISRPSVFTCILPIFSPPIILQLNGRGGREVLTVL